MNKESQLLILSFSMQFSKKEKALILILNDSRYQFIFFSMLLYIICAVEYKGFVIGKYEYMGFRDHFSLFKSIVAACLFSFSSLFVFLRTSDFIKGFTGLLHILFLLPVLVVFQFDFGGEIFVISSLFLMILINLNVRLVIPRAVKLKSDQIPWFLLLLASLIFVPFLISYNVNLNSSLFLLGKEVYEIRAAIKEDGNIFTGYLLSPLVQTLLPIMAIFGLSTRRFYFTVIAIVLTVVMYMMIPQKSIFLGIFVVLFFYFFKSPLRKVSVFAGILVSISLFGIILTNVFDSLMIESLLIRRYLIIPAYLNHVYYEVFDGAYLMYSYSFLSSFFHYPYDVEPTFLIGEAAFGKIETNANNGFLSDAYMNFGTVGVFVFTLMVAGLIKFFDQLSIDAKFFGLFFLLLNLIRSSALPTIVLTHGLWLFILLSYIILRNPKNQIKKLH